MFREKLYRYLPRSVFYGRWLVVLTLLLNAATGSPVFGGVGVWVDALEREFGWTRTELSIAFSLGQLEAGLVGPFIGVVVDRLGSRKVVLMGVLTTAVGFVVLSSTKNLPTFYISYVIIFLGAAAGGWLPLMTALNNWFDKKRSLAMGIGGIGFSMGSFLLVPALAWMVAPGNVGWQKTALALGVVFLIIAFPVSKLVRNNPEEYGEVPDGISNQICQSCGERVSRNDLNCTTCGAENSFGSASSTGTGGYNNVIDNPDYSAIEILRIPAFWLISLCHGLSTMLIMTMSLHLILAFRDQGISVQTGALIWGFTMGISGLSQIIGGYFGDRIPKNIGLCVLGCFQSMAVLYATLINQENVWILAPVFCIVFGGSFGGRMPLATSIRGEYFGRKAFGKVLGLGMIPMMIFMTSGTLFAGYWYDVQNSYNMAFYILGSIAFLGSFGFLYARKPSNMIK